MSDAPYNPGPGFSPGSGYGPRPSPGGVGSTNHKGMDFPAKTGTSIPAAADGTVYHSGSMAGYGNTVVLEHDINGNKVYTLYGHLDEPSPLKKGDAVSQGDSVGKVGNTGKGTGPHLHFEVIPDQPNPLKKGHETYDPKDFKFPSPPDSSGDGGDPSEDDDSEPDDGGDGSSGGPSDDGGDDASDGTSPQRIDPLALDLDGDGIETVGTRNGAPITFDHNGDGVKEGTGWLGQDDGWLVLDRNANGAVDTGGELFGVDTILSNGQKARNGFEALRENDVDGNGQIDASDPIFATLKIWRDLNQDGISQSHELTSLDQEQIISIGVNETVSHIDFENGNRQTAAGTYVKAGNSVGETGLLSLLSGNLDLLINTFHGEFTDYIPLSEVAAQLPNLKGTGRVRSLQEAATLSPTLASFVSTYIQEQTREGQIASLDAFIDLWASTSEFKPLRQQASELSASGAQVSVAYSLQGITSGTSAYEDFLHKLGVVERFMGFTYGGPNGDARITPLNADSGNLVVAFDQTQIQNITNAYERFKSDIYGSLLLSSRLSKYYDQADTIFSNGEWINDFSGMEAAFRSAILANPNSGLVDLVEFIVAIGYRNLDLMGWDWKSFLSTQVDSTKQYGSFLEELGKWSIRFGSQDDIELSGTGGMDFILGTIINGQIHGRDGNDLIIGGINKDLIDGGAGNDYVYGGSGNDTISDPYGDDTLDGGAGDDTITDTSSNSGANTLRGGDGNDTVTFSYSSGNTVEGGAGNDLIKISTFTGNSTAYQSNTLSGGAGDDRIESGMGADTYLFNRGDGQDTISDYDYAGAAKADRLVFGAGIAVGDVTASRSGNNLVLTIADPANPAATDRVTIENWENGYYRIEQIVFADGTIWTPSQIARKRPGIPSVRCNVMRQNW